MKQANLTTKNEDPSKIIHEELHGQFIEFLGECIHGGLWVGKDSKIENKDGVRGDVLAALKQLQPPVIRWPGGCYADTYHWRDGIGPKRKKVWNENFGTYEQEDNGFGTHEFMALCEEVGAKPWLNVNMMSGSVREMRDWAEYCNRKEETDLSLERAKNGHPEPFNVEFWGIGNEAWCGGGNYTPQSYVNEYRKYASALPAFHENRPFDPVEGIEMKCIAVGPDGNKPKERVAWTKDLFASLGEYRMPPLFGMDLHFYNWNLKDVHQDETVFDTDDAYRIMQGAMELEDVILEQSKLIQEGLEALPKPEGDLPAATPVCSLVIGEWGNWHGKAFINRPALFQQASMLDAITTALTLDIFHRNCDKVSMACIAQSINVLNSLILTKDDKMLLTPNYDVFEMYKVHRNAHIVELEVQSEEIEGTSLKNLYTLASAKDNKLFINLVHTNVDEPMQVNLGLDGNAYEFVSGKILASDDIHNHNTFENPNLVRAKAMENVSYDEAENCWKVVLPAASVCTLQFQKKS